MKRLLPIFFLFWAVQGFAQEPLPQEMVFVHTDNTCYFLGDTLYYKAYVQRSDTGKPTNLSEVLYVELLNQDDYLAYCEDEGLVPDKSYTGVLNVRLTPAIHRQIAMLALQEGISINAFIKNAVEEKVEEDAVTW